MSQRTTSAPEPAHSTEAESSCIGITLVNPKKFYEVSAELQPDDFYHPALRSIYEAMIELDHAGKPIDALTVAEQMRALGTIDKLRAFGGTDYFTELMAKIVTTENISYHARIVREKAVVRRLGEAARQVSAAAYDPSEYSSDGFLQEAESRLFDVFQQRRRSEFRPHREILKKVLGTIESRTQRAQTVTGVPTGFTNIDQATAGIQPGHLWVVAGRPKMGKSSWVGNVTDYAASLGFPALGFSLEMPAEEWVERNLCSRAGVSSTLVRTGALTWRELVPLTKAASETADFPIFIDDNPGLSFLELRAKAMRWRANSNIFKDPNQIGLLWIDFIQLIKGRAGGRDDNRHQQLAEIAYGLKGLAKELRCGIVALSQLNRGLEQRSDKRPVESDIRESGAIEEAADLIAGIYRDEVYTKDECKDEDKGVAEWIILKQRGGPEGTCKLLFQAPYTRFINLPERQRELPQLPFRGLEGDAGGERTVGEDDDQ
jgi:replicative DNA helicase